MLTIIYVIIISNIDTIRIPLTHIMLTRPTINVKLTLVPLYFSHTYQLKHNEQLKYISINFRSFSLIHSWYLDQASDKLKALLVLITL